MNPTWPGIPAGHRSGYVAIVGQPNVGKSTLLNEALQYKLAIVSDRPQTTRNRIMGIRTDDNSQILFVDTPGIHDPFKELNKLLMDHARRALEDVDLILFMVDAREKDWTEASRFTLDTVTKARAPKLLVPNKIDLVEKPALLPLLDRYQRAAHFDELIPICARTGEGVLGLLEVIKKRLPEGPRYFPEDQLSDLHERDIAAELVREQIFRNTDQEIPYSTAVLIEQFKEIPEKNRAHIHATIVVEKESQKGIIIGKKGQMLTRIGTAARLELEKVLGIKLFLELFVRVEPNWTRDPRALRRLGMMDRT